MHRNFEWRVSPRGGQRNGRCYVAAKTFIGAPVKQTDPAESDGVGRNKFELATGAQAPVNGKSGLCIYEYKGDDGWAGDDQYLTTTSDKTHTPASAAVQVVSGTTVKVAFRNTNDVKFLNTRTYDGLTVVSEGAGATPNVNVGDYLTPGAGTDEAGYWAVTTDAAQAWLVVTSVDDARGEVEARLMF
jgi:hypothetical protein